MNVVLLAAGNTSVPILAPKCCWSGIRLSGGLLSLLYSIFSNSKDHLHIMRAAPATYSSVDVLAVAGGDEVVILARTKLKTSWRRRKAAERDGEVHEGLRPVTNGDNPGPRIGDPARVKLVLVDAVDDVLLCICNAGLVHWTYQVDLIVLGRGVALVHHDQLRLSVL